MDRELLHAFIEECWDKWLETKGIGLELEKPTADSPEPATFTDVEVAEEATPVGPKVVNDTRAVRAPSTGDKVYLINEKDMTKRWVTNPEVLKAHGFGLEDVVEIKDIELSKYKPSSAVLNAPKA